mgnify:CR=1 FL=1|tara:strand:+ start:255 stop:641 length:387 start_codon:yes stop_codon:yes gene_type:complete
MDAEDIKKYRSILTEGSAYGPDEKLADLSKIKTDKLQQLHALLRHYGQKDPRSKESANRGAAELKNRGVIVPVDESGLTSDGTILGQADEYVLELDADGTVHLLDGEKTIRVSMPLDIWQQLIKTTVE